MRIRLVLINNVDDDAEISHKFCMLDEHKRAEDEFGFSHSILDDDES